MGRVSTAQAAVNALSREILNGDLEPGSFLREVELAERFQISRQSLRTALAELVHLGLLRREAHRGVWVPVLTKQDMRDVYYVRDIVESEAVKRASANPAGWPAIELAVRAMEGLRKDSPWADIVEADFEIHRAIVGATGSPRLARAHEMVYSETRLITVRARKYQTLRRMVREHRELFDVIRQGDPRVAALRFRDHLDFGTADLMAELPDAIP